MAYAYKYPSKQREVMILAIESVRVQSMSKACVEMVFAEWIVRDINIAIILSYPITNTYSALMLKSINNRSQ